MEHYMGESGKHAAILCLVLAGFLITVPVSGESALPSGTSQFKVVKGMAIYIGIVPAEILEGHIANRVMHGGLPVGPVRFHLTVAIFNHKTGQRINNAKVTAQIFTIPEKTGYKELELMEFGKVMVYGNYFSMEALGPYLIQLHITHERLHEPIDVEFQYQSAYVQL